MRNYRDLEVWEKAHKLTLQLYLRSRQFSKEEFYGLTSQRRRSAMSVGANLAEGCGRQTTPEIGSFRSNRHGISQRVGLPSVALKRFWLFRPRRVSRVDTGVNPNSKDVGISPFDVRIGDEGPSKRDLAEQAAGFCNLLR